MHSIEYKSKVCLIKCIIPKLFSGDKICILSEVKNKLYKYLNVCLLCLRGDQILSNDNPLIIRFVIPHFSDYQNP